MKKITLEDFKYTNSTDIYKIKKTYKRKFGGNKKFWYLLNNGNLLYSHNFVIRYVIDLNSYKTNSELLDTIFQLYKKPENYKLLNFIEAIENIFVPQANCCSCGENKKFSGKDLTKNYVKNLVETEEVQNKKIEYYPDADYIYLIKRIT